MDVMARLNEIMEKQGLTQYQLSKLSGLAQSTLSNISARNTIPSIPTSESICDFFNISLAQFFADENTEFYPVDKEQREMLDLFLLLDDKQKTAMLNLMRTMKPEFPKKDQT